MLIISTQSTLLKGVGACVHWLQPVYSQPTRSATSLIGAYITNYLNVTLVGIYDECFRIF